MRAATILHVDLDAFFAAVEQRDRPELRGKPVIVGGGGPDQRGVVSAASYEARVFGVRSAMPLRTAGRLCPQGIFVPVDGAKYGRASKDVMAIIRRFTPRVEQISIDEAFLDVAGSEALFGDPPAIARQIKDAIKGELELTVVGRRGRDPARRQDRLGAREAGRAGRRAGRDRGGIPGATPDLAAVGRGREDARGARGVRRGDDRGPRGDAGGPAAPPVGPARAVAACSAPAVSTRRRSATARRPRPSRTSTRSTSIRTTGRSSSGPCSGSPRASRAGCARAA